jgi:hypothetical protein
VVESSRTYQVINSIVTAALGEERPRELRARGAEMDWEQAVAYTLTQTNQALNELNPKRSHERVAPAPPAGNGMTLATGSQDQPDQPILRAWIETAPTNRRPARTAGRRAVITSPGRRWTA